MLSGYPMIALAVAVCLAGGHALSAVPHPSCTSTDNGTVLQLFCKPHSTFNFSDVRQWILNQSRSALHLHIVCGGGILILTHPLEAGNLTELRIYNCVRIKGMFANFQKLPEPLQPVNMTLQVLEVINSSYLYHNTQVHRESERLKKIYGCMTFYPRGLRILIQRRTKFEEETQFEENFDGFQGLPFGNICNYDNLEVYERSMSRPVHGVMGQETENEIFYFLRNGNFKSLRIANLSNTNLEFIPAQFTEYNWFRRFRSLEIIDLSHNKIREIPYLRSPFFADVKLILRYNNISRITTTLIDKLKFSNMMVDLSKNKFICACENDPEPLLRFLQNRMEEHWVKKYGYLADEACFYPSRIHGVLLKSLDSLILCPDNNVTEIPTILSIVLILLILTAFICIVIKFRHEIKILTYTRLGIRFWRQRRNNVLRLKEYDAFISYSALDECWVLGTLCKRLEGLSVPLTLCLHHKHFVLGACISDNIIDSVEKSRHTIIVLSENFLQSEWCLLEFRKAFHQTLLERRRHLIVILMDEVNVHQLEPEMSYFLQSHTYLRRTDTLFWDRLIYALSDTPIPSSGSIRKNNSPIKHSENENVHLNSDKHVTLA